MSGMIHDRSSYRNEAVENVAKSWADFQVVGLPSMSFTTQKDKIDIVNELELNSYETSVKINTELRKKGIFKVPVYTADVTQKGTFNNKYGDLSKHEITTSIWVKDARGFVSEPSFSINNMPAKSSQDIAYNTKLNTSAKTIPFEISYKIKGLNSIDVQLGGHTNNIFIEGNWKDPSFEGNFLPTEREVTNKDFTAKWSVPLIALSKDKNATSFVKVSLLVPVDNYSMAERSLKYGFLLLALTFMGYFIFEITSKENKRIHPIQYCLLGAAILMFYLLLVSISELLSFNIAYLISAFLVMGMVLMYTYFVITKKQSFGFALSITSLIGLLYAYFYTLLRLQDIALFAGSIGLFIIIAAIMYLTRNVNWYNE
jgi:inner membrane protein